LVEDDSGRHWVQFQHGIIHRHVSLTVAATFTVERSAEAGGFEMAPPREGFGEAGGLRHFWYPRAILSASGKSEEGGELTYATSESLPSPPMKSS
jgi:hypothetical protein